MPRGAQGGYGPVTDRPGSMCHEKASEMPERPNYDRHAHEPITVEDADLDYLRKHVMALQRVLQAKGLVTYGEVLQEVHKLEESDHASGQRVVARAWTDPAFKERLLRDGKAA